MKTVGTLYHEAKKTLSMKEQPQYAAQLARELTAHFTSVPIEQILAQPDTPVAQEACAKLEFAVSRVLGGEPLAYVLEQWDFYGLRLHVDKNVLIPRDDTCAVTELAISQGMFLEENPRILDLCTGSGCIGLAVASRVKDAKVTLGDISRQALLIAKKNAAELKLSGRVTCVQVDALEKPAPFLGKFDMIVCNPPYITTEQMGQLPHSVKDFEPHLALHGGEDGLIFYRAIAKKYAQALKNGGYLCFEFGMGQGDDVCRILEENGYTILERSRDYNDRERAVIARLRRKED